MKRLLVLMTLAALTIGMAGCCGQRPFARWRRQAQPAPCSPCATAGPMMEVGEVITVPADQLPGPAGTAPGS